ncbi:MAG: M23 family metallopeptidase [Reichenbachiella sp.]
MSFHLSEAQAPEKGDFQFPIRPKQENYLSGTVGELRSTHFHTGIDIKTSGITGLPVFAAADGYVQRVRVSTSGYGNTLYIFHPQNNTITVYAHLKYFEAGIAEYIRVHQYKNQSFDVNLFPKEGQFTFKKGDIIAKSGNSGSSSGPHLHFELRSVDHRALDPLRYGFDEIDDSTPPVLEKVAFVTMDDKSRINGAFGRFEFDVIKNAQGELVLDNAVFLSGNIGVEVYAYDRFDRARNRNGILNQSLMFDDKQVFSQSIDSLKFSMARSILVHTNYQRSTQGGKRFNKYYVDDGNSLGFYKTDDRSGILQINDPLKHELTIRLGDSYGNIVQHNFDINGDEQVNLENKIWDNIEEYGYDISGNYIEVMTDLSDFGYCEAEVYQKGKMSSLQLGYDHGDKGFYIWDLRKGLPDSIKVCNDTFVFDFAATIYPGKNQSWSTNGISINFPKRSLFDTTYLKFSKDTSGNKEVYSFRNSGVPIKRNFKVTISSETKWNEDKAFAYTIGYKGKLGFLGGKWTEDGLSFETRDFGNYTILEDSIPPVISSLKTKKGKLKFRLKDDKSGIKSIKAQLNGEWFLMNYDAKSNVIWSDEAIVVSGDFILNVEDYCGNKSLFERTY